MSARSTIFWRIPAILLLIVMPPRDPAGLPSPQLQRLAEACAGRLGLARARQCTGMAMTGDGLWRSERHGAGEAGVPLMATNDPLYAAPGGERDLQDVLTCIRLQGRHRFRNRGTYPAGSQCRAPSQARDRKWLRLFRRLLARSHVQTEACAFSRDRIHARASQL